MAEHVASRVTLDFVVSISPKDFSTTVFPPVKTVGGYMWTFEVAFEKLEKEHNFSSYSVACTDCALLAVSCACTNEKTPSSPTLTDLIHWGGSIEIYRADQCRLGSANCAVDGRVPTRFYTLIHQTIGDNWQPEIKICLDLRVEEAMKVESMIVEPKRLNRLDSLLQSGLLSDVTLRTEEGEEVPAHRCILAAQSDFFKTKFKPEWKGAVVDVGLSLPILKEMLRYMYTGNIEEDTDVIKLLVAADMYLVTDLCSEIKYRLGQSLLSNKPAASIYDMLKLSISCTSPSLQNVVLRYMKEHQQVFQSEEWKDFQEENRQMAAETLLNMFNLSD